MAHAGGACSSSTELPATVTMDSTQQRADCRVIKADMVVFGTFGTYISGICCSYHRRPWRPNKRFPQLESQGLVFSMAKNIFARTVEKPVKTMVITSKNRNKLRLA